MPDPAAAAAAAAAAAVGAGAGVVGAAAVRGAAQPGTVQITTAGRNRAFLPLAVQPGVAVGHLLDAMAAMRGEGRRSWHAVADGARALSAREKVVPGRLRLIIPGCTQRAQGRPAPPARPKGSPAATARATAAAAAAAASFARRKVGPPAAVKSAPGAQGRSSSVLSVPLSQGKEEVRSLGDALRAARQEPPSRRLDVAACEAGDVGARAVAAWLRSHQRHAAVLSALDISGNVLGSRGMRAVAEALPSGVEEVDAKQNRGDGWADGIAAFAAALRRRKGGVVRAGAIDDADAAALAKALRRVVAQQQHLRGEPGPVSVLVGAKRVPFVWRHTLSGAGHADCAEDCGGGDAAGVLTWRGCAELHDDALAVADVSVEVARSSAITIPPVPEADDVAVVAMPETARVDCRRLSRIPAAGKERLCVYLSGAASLRRVDLEWAHTQDAGVVMQVLAAVLANPLVSSLWVRGLQATAGAFAALPPYALRSAAVRIVEVDEPYRRSPASTAELTHILKLPQLSALLLTTPASRADLEAAASSWRKLLCNGEGGAAGRHCLIAARCSRRSDAVVAARRGGCDTLQGEPARQLWAELQQHAREELDDFEREPTPSLSDDPRPDVSTWAAVAAGFGRPETLLSGSEPCTSWAAEVDAADIGELLRSRGVREGVVQLLAAEAMDGPAFCLLDASTGDEALRQIGVADPEDRRRVLQCQGEFKRMLRAARGQRSWDSAACDATPHGRPGGGMGSSSNEPARSGPVGSSSNERSGCDAGPGGSLTVEHSGQTL
eukprot:TRINITY_DN19053_c0_g1_i2.p1 TRINITY_DN19053_c0_g1~~TRINITY_DN19053_c0_g1_i2.p1  ORF type:complete len:781 (+),score=245.64 TRINITY_DN19053_c0_g1_i2:140-2482(+)